MVRVDELREVELGASRSTAATCVSNQSAWPSSSRTISSKTWPVPWSPRSWHSWAPALNCATAAFSLSSASRSISSGDSPTVIGAEPLQVGVAVEEQDPVDERVGVLHLVDRQVVEDLAEPAEAPVVEHPRVQEVGVGDRELEGERLVEQLDDAGANWLQRLTSWRPRAVHRTDWAPCSHSRRFREKTQEPQSRPAPVERQTPASVRAPASTAAATMPVVDDAAVADDHRWLLRVPVRAGR